MNVLVRMRVTGGDAKFDGEFVSLVCPIGDCGYFIDDLLDTNEEMAEKITISFERIETPLSLEEWCAEHDVDCA